MPDHLRLFLTLLTGGLFTKILSILTCWLSRCSQPFLLIYIFFQDTPSPLGGMPHITADLDVFI